jgi:hypothetical protein
MDKEKIEKIGWTCIIITSIILTAKAIFVDCNKTENYFTNTTPPIQGPNNIVLTDDAGNFSSIQFPQGMIMAWLPPTILPLTGDKFGGGGVYPITPPAGWGICDGSNGTPDLRGKFLLGTNSNTSNNVNYTVQEVNILGGEENHVLTTAEMPAHTHTYTDVYYVENSGVVGDLDLIEGGNNKRGSGSTDGDNSYFGKTKSTGSVGTGTSHNNMPPFYTVIYIMKL